MIGGHRIAVIIPAYNEEKLLPRTLGGLPGYVDLAIVVDDASTDQTAALAQRFSRVHLARHESNQGVGAAIVTGYRAALDLGADLCVVMGADNQMHPEDMPALLWPLIHDTADYVTGDRLAWPDGWKAFPGVRLFGVLSLAAMTRWATACPDIRDAQCGYTAITRQALEAIRLDRLYPRYGFPNDMVAEVLRCKLRLSTRPVRPIYGEETSKLKVQRVIAPLLKLTARNWVLRVTAPSPSPSLKDRTVQSAVHGAVHGARRARRALQRQDKKS